MKYQIATTIRSLMSLKQYSERRLCELAGVSRSTLRRILSGNPNINIKSLLELSSFLEQDVVVLTVPKSVQSEYSTVATALFTERDGFDSWKIHFMNFVDNFRRAKDPRLVLLPPHSGFDPRLKALLAATVSQLCDELQIQSPAWSLRRYFLEQPWFLSEMNSLKASAVIESPLAFRRNHIFVHANFLDRA